MASRVAIDKNTIAWIYAGGRVAIGIGAIAAPGFASRAVSRRDEAIGIEPLFARMLGARDVALGFGTAVALRSGAPVRGWLEVSAFVDTVDGISGVVASEDIALRTVVGTAAVAAASAAVGAILSRRFDR